MVAQDFWACFACGKIHSLIRSSPGILFVPLVLLVAAVDVAQ